MGPAWLLPKLTIDFLADLAFCDRTNRDATKWAWCVIAFLFTGIRMFITAYIQAEKHIVAST